MKKPRPRVLRDIAVAAITPLIFSFRTGHLRSSLTGLSVDRYGGPLPWVTYPAIAFLQRIDLSNADVLEFGAGQSTRWFAAHARSVVSYEDDPTWAKVVRESMPGTSNVSIIDTPPVPHAAPPGQFDLVLIDGCDRAAVARIAIDRVKPDGIVIFDNSEGDWGPSGTAPIIDMFRDAGFMRVDFYGFSPGNRGEHCTSIFFRAGCRFLAATRPLLHHA